MILRAMMPRDLPFVKAIHEKYYGQEFPLPDFVTNYRCAFVVVDEDGRIITAGGIRTLLEAVLLTDKSFSPSIRKEALLDFLAASIYVAQKEKYEGIHAFIQDEQWANRLRRFGFLPTKGEALYLALPEAENAIQEGREEQIQESIR